MLVGVLSVLWGFVVFVYVFLFKEVLCLRRIFGIKVWFEFGLFG